MEEQAKLLNDYIARVEAARPSAHEQLDRAILTLSTGGLALSLGFVEKAKAYEPACLRIGSWGLFLVAISSTVWSLYLAPFAINEMTERAVRCLQQQDLSATGMGPKSVWIARLNRVSTISFILAIAVTVLFIEINLEGR